jgi:hypothetical protein
VEAFMGVAMDFRKEIISLSRELSGDQLKELIDFAQFLKVKEEGAGFSEVRDSAEYVRRIRMKEGTRIKSSKNFIEELIEWQKSNC